jgi:LacI family transcriptional regulator
MGTDRRLPSQRDVSAVLNPSSTVKIAEATRRRVWAAAEELGFRPNEMARSLRSRSSNVLGLVSSEIATTPYAVAIIKGAQEAALARGMMLLIIDTDGAPEITDDALAAMTRWRVEGLILAADHHRAIDPHATGTPTVLVNCFAADGSLGGIVPDERQGGRLATETLLAAGHRRIGFINGPDDFPASTGRLAGYLDAHRAAGLPVDPRLSRTGDWWQESARGATSELLGLDDPPTALFCANDWMAMGAYDAIRERGLGIPDDVAVIGFDNRIEIAAHLSPTLTTIALPYREMGRRAVEYLVADGPATDLVPCPLVPRQSVRAPS